MSRLNLDITLSGPNLFKIEFRKLMVATVILFYKYQERSLMVIVCEAHFWDHFWILWVGYV